MGQLTLGYGVIGCWRRCHVRWFWTLTWQMCMMMCMTRCAMFASFALALAFPSVLRQKN